jgi:dUTP pyrophosphatase
LKEIMVNLTESRGPRPACPSGQLVIAEEKSATGFREIPIKVEIMYHDSEMPKLTNIGGVDHSCAIDLYTSEDTTLYPGAFAKIPLGISVKIPKGYKADIRPRSSTFSNFGIIQTNSVGLIDTTYCGPDDIWSMPVFKPITMDDVRMSMNGHGDMTTVIPKGTRLCQMEIVKRMPNVDFIESDLSEEVNRGGFGQGTKSF